jgi:uncharacterized MnhB-related membrane protein
MSGMLFAPDCALGRAIVPAAVFQAAFRPAMTIRTRKSRLESRLQPGLAAPQIGLLL